ncbi:hypothetical protein SLEP1_g54882 [Rubroshorea leprosula]|uniref:Reverse transcriptase Ty1/copia-type domain-containing protein n=1 Tax=Rubroshorea leprosula TaxID=152421 RepID=A0AAV5MEZ0_9ROSI|nr:hypothetical protein SLEP1_g54882 [Rubroshorea leprosula]
MSPSFSPLDLSNRPISPCRSTQVMSHGAIHKTVPSSKPACESQVLTSDLSSPPPSPNRIAFSPHTLVGSPSSSPSSSSAHSNSSSLSTSSGSPSPPLAPPQPFQTHPMVTQAQNNIFQTQAALPHYSSPCYHLLRAHICVPSLESTCLETRHGKGGSIEHYKAHLVAKGNDSGLLCSLVHKMGQCFSLKDLGPLTFFLGVEAIHTPAGLLLSQHKYIFYIFHRANMDSAKPVSTPLPSSTHLSSSAGSALSDGSDYQHILGSLQYLTLTRPDILFAVSRLSQYMHQPTDLHWQALKRVLQYLRGTIYHGLLLRPQSSLSLHAYSESD